MSELFSPIISFDILILSLVQDVKCLDTILGDISPQIEDIGIKSWLHPEKNFSDLDKNFEVNELTYEKCLEMLIERYRLYIIINFINIKFKKNRKKISNSPIFTLGACVKQFWDSLGPNENKSIKMLAETPPNENYILNRGTQTDSQTLDKCDSCTEATNFLKEIIEYLSTNFQNSSTKNERDYVRDNIFETTKFGATLRYTNAIKQDYEHAVQKFNEISEDNKNLEEKNRTLMLEVKQKEHEIADLSAIKTKFLEMIEASEEELKSVKNTNGNIEREKEELQEKYNKHILIENDLANLVETLQKKRAESQKILDQQVAKYEELLNEFKTKENSLCNSKYILEENYEKLKAKYGELYGKYSKMSEMNFKLESNLSDIISATGDINKKAENINKFIIQTSDETTILHRKIQNLKLNTSENDELAKKFRKIHNFLLDSLGRKEQKDTKIALQGNPLLDFPKQIEENEVAIRKLEQQNRKLETIMKAYQKKRLT